MSDDEVNVLKKNIQEEDMDNFSHNIRVIAPYKIRLMRNDLSSFVKQYIKSPDDIVLITMYFVLDFIETGIGSLSKTTRDVYMNTDKKTMIDTINTIFYRRLTQEQIQTLITRVLQMYNRYFTKQDTRKSIPVSVKYDPFVRSIVEGDYSGFRQLLYTVNLKQVAIDYSKYREYALNGFERSVNMREFIMADQYANIYNTLKNVVNMDNYSDINTLEENIYLHDLFYDYSKSNKEYPINKTNLIDYSHHNKQILDKNIRSSDAIKEYYVLKVKDGIKYLLSIYEAKEIEQYIDIHNQNSKKNEQLELTETDIQNIYDANSKSEAKYDINSKILKDKLSIDLDEYIYNGIIKDKFNHDLFGDDVEEMYKKYTTETESKDNTTKPTEFDEIQVLKRTVVKVFGEDILKGLM